MRHLCISLLVLPWLLACGKPPPPDEPLRAVRTTTVELAPAQQQLSFAAEVRARTESRLGFRVGGKLVRRLVNAGDLVRPGQLLAELDAGDLQLGQDAARAALRAAEAQLALSQAELKRYRQLADQGFISGVELTRRETALQAAQAQAEQARAQAGVQGNQAAYARLLADAAGVVTAVEAEPGAVLGAGTPVLRLAQDGPRDAVFNVPEQQAALFRGLLGRPGALQLRAWGSDGAASPATVREVAAAADPATRTFVVKADMGATALRLGQTATVLLRTPAAAPSAIKLPLTAVFEQGGRAVVWVVDRASMTVRVQPVAVAGAEGNLALIGGGLQPGQDVVTAGVHVLSPGQKVRWYAEPSAAVPAPVAAAASR